MGVRTYPAKIRTSLRRRDPGPCRTVSDSGRWTAEVLHAFFLLVCGRFPGHPGVSSGPARTVARAWHQPAAGLEHGDDQAIRSAAGTFPGVLGWGLGDRDRLRNADLGWYGAWVWIVVGAVLPSVVALGVVFPAKGLPVDRKTVVGALLLNAAWGLGVVLILELIELIVRIG